MIENELKNIDEGRLMWYYSQMPSRVRKKGRIFIYHVVDSDPYMTFMSVFFEHEKNLSGSSRNFYNKHRKKSTIKYTIFDKIESLESSYAGLNYLVITEFDEEFEISKINIRVGLGMDEHLLFENVYDW
ncbi:MAG: hypothetical protein IPL46_31630 [Saprospiraceae bacterium]|nr:hypothetical protein [Saprospiraceae bacterium]